MSKDLGIWIDHVSAHLVELHPDAAPNLRIIESDAERAPHASGHQSNRSSTHRATGAHNRVEHRRDQELHRFYESVMDAAEHADRLFLFGPDGAKHELESAMRQRRSLGQRVLAVESADRLTEPQLIARVRDFFTAHAPLRHR